MEFGQSLDTQALSKMHFALPSLDSAEELVQVERLKRAALRSKLRSTLNSTLSSEDSPQIYVGVPIFAHAPWVGNFYPEGTSPGEFLKEYAKQLSTVELNSTFYAIPPEANFLKWKASVGPEFRFCPKFPKSVSHSLDPDHPDLKIFLERVMLLGGNLGVCFLQLPHYFSQGDQSRLMALLSKVPRSLRTVVELRNADFFQNQRLKQDWLEAIASRFIGSVTIDTPLERQVAHVSLTSTRVMIRFLGANLHDSDFTRLEEWAKRIAFWHVNGMKEIYFLLHEPENSVAPVAMKKMIEFTNAELEIAGASYRLPQMQWHSLFEMNR